MAETGPIYLPSSIGGALRQGEIVSGLVQVRIALDSIGLDQAPEVDQVTHSLAVVMSQDCDLDWDFTSRQQGTSTAKLMPNVLFCELIEAAVLRGSSDINSSIWGRIRINKDERYHFLQKVSSIEDALGQGLPEMGLDFKRYFTIPTDEVYQRLDRQAKRRCRLASPYLEHLSSRFFAYQARVALPAEHLSE